MLNRGLFFVLDQITLLAPIRLFWGEFLLAMLDVTLSSPVKIEFGARAPGHFGSSAQCLRLRWSGYELRSIWLVPAEFPDSKSARHISTHSLDLAIRKCGIETDTDAYY